ncbi:S-adenosylmethionine decarboxylase [Cellulomonas sp. NPDC089187]|uniref:S-adenosylmethionine decarboxylase family protein n=1 Tax=Cellulomonas sp. NPDC089187 TaxID=3154970 RepID=UPI00343097F2
MSRHFVVVFDVEGADAARLDEVDRVRSAMDRVIALSGLHPVGAPAEHRFDPHGISRVQLMAESHVAVHTWPEIGSAYLTLVSCRAPEPQFEQAAADVLATLWGGSVTVGRL